jgi:adhesin HecA-like repeat protein
MVSGNLSIFFQALQRPCWVDVRWLGRAPVLVLLAAVVGCASPQSPPPDEKTGKQELGNWNFETGDFTGWRTRSTGNGAWHVYEDGARPPDPTDTDPNYPFKVPEPPEGRFAAVTDMRAPGTRILYRDVELDGRFKLSFTVFYESHEVRFSSPANLDQNHPEPNLQFRVDLIDPAARLDSLAAKDVLATIFRTARGDPGKLEPRTLSFDLSRWAGQKVRLRFAQVDNRGPLRAGVDDVRLEAVGG